AAGHPDADDREGVRNDRRNELGRCKDAHPDHVCDDEDRRVDGAETPVERARLHHLPFATGLPSDVHFTYPPVTARTSAKPTFRKSSAARALVCSAGQLQYVTIGLRSDRSCSRCEDKSASSIHNAPGMCPARNSSSDRTSTTTIEPSARRFLKRSNAILKSR